MSWQASSWALELTLGDARRKMVLVAIASYADKEGKCAFASLTTLAQNCDLTEGALRRRIRELEQIGVINRFVRRIVEGGKIVSESVDGPQRDDRGAGKGRRTSDEFWVDMSVPTEEIAAAVKRLSASPPHGDEAKENAPETPLDVVGCEGTKSSPPLASEANAEHPPQRIVSDPPHREGGILPANPKEDSHPTLPSGRALPSQIDQEAEARFDTFRSDYPDGIVDLEKARAAFLALPNPDQDAAIAGLALYSARCKGRREKSMKAHLYVRKRVWEGLSAKQAARDARGLYDRNSREAKAITVLHRIAGAPRPLEIGDRLSSSVRITPKVLALADAPPEREWKAYPLGTAGSGSWRDLIEEALPPAIGRPRLTEIRAPWPFPPSVDGKIYTVESTGPPRELLTESDEEFMADGF